MMDVLSLNDRLIACGLATKRMLYSLNSHSKRCFMMMPLGSTVAPDGRLYNCSHDMEPAKCVGSVSGYNPKHPVRPAFLQASEDGECASCRAFFICRGGCRIGELGLARMYRCHPCKTVLAEIQRRHDEIGHGTFDV